MSVRPRHPNDLDACGAALHEVHRHDAYPIQWPADPLGWLDPPGLTGAWVAELDGTIAGHVAIVGSEVSRLFVAPRGRGLGLAQELLSAAVAASPVPLELDVVDGTGAVGFYERMGWRLVGVSAATWALSDGQRPMLRRYVHGEVLPSADVAT